MLFVERKQEMQVSYILRIAGMDDLRNLISEQTRKHVVFSLHAWNLVQIQPLDLFVIQQDLYHHTQH